MSLPILLIAIPGILTTTTFLLIYYIFVIKCCLNPLPLFSASRRHASTSPATPEPTGLDAAAIDSIPTLLYTPLPFSAPAECAVCLSEFRPGERLRLLPNCAHAFHVDCIDAWLQSKTSCPICRSQIDNRVVEGGERRRVGPAVSVGDECVELVGRDKDEIFGVHVLRRSLSLDSSAGGGGGRRSFFLFGNGWSSRRGVQPVDIDV